jgi:multidrug resistance efflux pump
MVRWFSALTLILAVVAGVDRVVASGSDPDNATGSLIVLDDEPKDKEAKDKDSGKDADAAKKTGDEDKKKADESAKEKAKEADKAEDAKKEPSKAEDAKDEKNSDKKEEAKADEKAAEKKPAKEEKKKADAFKVKKKDLKIEVETEAVFVADEAKEVALRPEVWTQFKVVEAVPHGTRVHKGDTLVKFDDKDIEESLEEKALQLHLGEIALMEAEEEFPRLEKSIELNYDQSKREYDQAQDELERFQKIMRDMSQKMATYYLKSAEQEYQNAKEELDQLEKMYKADELTEETEEIVLKRQRFQVDAAKFYVEYSKINHDYTVDVSIPRREKSLETAVDLAKIEFERAKMAKSLGMNEQRYQLEALRETRARNVESNSKLVADRALMELKAPIDGIAYYGRAVNGRWVEVGSMESKLVPYGTVAANSVVYTVVKERPLHAETSIGEKELPEVKDGQSVVVTPTADSDVEVEGKVKEVADVPGSGNKFTVEVNLKLENAPEWLVPGMTGKSKIKTYDVKDAIVIPADLVQSDEENPKKKYVMLQVEDEEKPVRREITLGKTKDKEVEVVKGLKEGDEIVKGAKDGKQDEEKKEEPKKDSATKSESSEE